MKGEKPVTKKVIAITMGDPAGIGPEIILKYLKNRNKYKDTAILVIGSGDVLEEAGEIIGIDLEIKKYKNINNINFSENFISLLDLDNIQRNEYNIGKVQKSCGQASVEYIYKAIDLAKERKVGAIVTGPIHKEAIKLAGVPYAGHTEILADKFNIDNYAMMLVEGDFRVVHVSTHVSLREACQRVKKDRIYKVIKLADEFLRKMGTENPKIAVAGLNPHAGEHGLFGSEEREEILPAVKKAAGENINVEGPVPADTVFAKARTNQYDIAVAMYHDQGHIPMKTVGFKYDEDKQEWLSVSGVNVTLGLPVIRTSVDHGVAFDIAGNNEASPDSLKEAVELAESMVSD